MSNKNGPDKLPRPGEARYGTEGLTDPTEYPPPTFDALNASPDDLVRYGLPARPNPDTQPHLFVAWRRLFEPPVTFVQAEAIEIEADFVQLPPQSLRSVIGRSRIEDSRNWCGATIAPNGGQKFVSIYGEWVVPTPGLPKFPDELGPAGQDIGYNCAIWVGLDGNRRYLDSTLPQIGTAQILKVSKLGVQSFDYYAWFQWWARDQVQIQRKRFLKIDVEPGMSVMGTISVMDKQHAYAYFRTFAGSASQFVKWHHHHPATIQDVHVGPGGPVVTPVISGSTAEWILERPMPLELDATDFELFPSYNPTQFTNCVAGTAATLGPSTGEEVLMGPTLLRMFEVPANAPSRTRLISMPELLDPTSLRVRYGGFT